jgi:hypothetical protein
MLSIRRAAGVALLCAVLLSSCGQRHSGNSGGNGSQPDPNAPTAAEQSVVFSNAQFIAPVKMHIPADDFASAQVLAAENNGTVDWSTFLGSQVGCVQQGYATVIGFRPMPSVDGYALDGHQLEDVLEQAHFRSVQSYSLTLNGTPWGSIARTFACTVNTGSTTLFAPFQAPHGELDVLVGERGCKHWTYVNHYQSPVPGQGNAQVFAGTFAYAMLGLVDGAQFSGDGTASVKMYLNPDNGQWTVLSFELHDPPLSFNGFSGVEQAAPRRTSCPVMAKTPA